jgi:RND family efflux transporter MFP subunit
MKNITVLAAACAILLWGGCSNQSDNTTDTVHSVLVVKPEASGSSILKKYSGIVAESKTISLGFKTAGQIEKTCVKEGDYVHKGQLIATLDDTDYKLAEREARIQYEQMAAEQKRLDYLHAANNVSDNDYEKSSAGLERLKVNLENCTNRLKYTRLYAPVSGYVVKLNFENAEMVNAGTPVIELMDNSSLEVDVDLPAQAYINRNRFNSFSAKTSQGEPFNVSLINITPKADNNQLYSMRLSVAKGTPSSLLTPGMNVEVNIDIAEADTTSAPEFTIPSRSIFYDTNHTPYVWVLSPDSTVNAVKVAVGNLADNGKVTVTSGLSGNETIVRAGVNSLTAGEKVKVIDEPRHTNVGKQL